MRWTEEPDPWTNEQIERKDRRNDGNPKQGSPWTRDEESRLHKDCGHQPGRKDSPIGERRSQHVAVGHGSPRTMSPIATVEIPWIASAPASRERPPFGRSVLTFVRAAYRAR